MESNKLLIGVQFIGENGASIVIELIVLRDITLKQLLDGIKYGLMKKMIILYIKSVVISMLIV